MQRDELIPSLATAAAAAAACIIARRRLAPPSTTVVASRALQPLLRKLPTLSRGYSPPPLIPFGVAQSGFSEACQPPKGATPFEREELVLPALAATPPRTSCCPAVVPEGLVTLDWLHPPPAVARPASPVCLIVPSLTGSSASGYVRRLSVALRAAGVRVACYHPRGLGGNPLRSRFPHSAPPHSGAPPPLTAV